MTVSELVSKTPDKIIIYKLVGDNHVTIFKGRREDIPSDILHMEVRVFGCMRQGVLDIAV